MNLVIGLVSLFLQRVVMQLLDELKPLNQANLMKTEATRDLLGVRFPRLASATCFPALGIGRMFFRAWHRLHVFPCLVSAARFSVLGIGCMFLSTLDTDCMFSRSWHRLLHP